MGRARREMTWVAVMVVLCSLGRGEPAAAQSSPCFRVSGTSEAAGRRVQHVVGLTSTVRLSSECTYSRSVEGPWASPEALAGREVDFLELLHHLGGAQPTAGGADPRFLFGRPPGVAPSAEPSSFHTLILRYCTHYLLEEQLGFHALPGGSDGGLRIEREPAGGAQQCDASEVELRAVSGEGELLSTSQPAGDQTLSVSQRALELPRGDWTLYAARPNGRVGLRVGLFEARGVSTPLQRRLRRVGLEPSDGAPAPLLATRWTAEVSGMVLAPTDEGLALDLLWAELRTAADAGLLWLARTDLPGSEAPVITSAVELESADPAAIRFPDRPVRRYMNERYGPAGEAMTPTLDDWRQILAPLALCLTPSYLEQRRPGIGASTPDPGSCGALSTLVALETAGGGGGGRGTGVCLQRGMQVMSAERARWTAHEGEPECLALPGAAEPMPFRVATMGDRLTLEQAGDACVLIDNRPLSPDADGAYHLDRSGLLEVRVGGGEGCTGAQALSRLRLPVLDPEREWHPVGLFTGEELPTCLDEEGGETSGRCPWRSLPHDDDEVFAFIRPRQTVDLRLSTSPAVAAAINLDPQAPVQLSQAIPMLSALEGELEGPRNPGVVAFLSDEATCPTGEEGTVEALRNRDPLEPDGLIVDQVFHLFLAAVEGGDQQPHCLARATFRVRHSRALVARSAGPMFGFELGLLGDTRAVVFVTEPIAVGLALPVFWVRLNLFPIRGYQWLGIEVAGHLTMAAAFDPAGVSRTGAALSASLELGIPRYVPRLLSVGVMLHGAFDSLPEEAGEDNNPIFSVYLGLDLSTLIDLAGGR